jgi:hypothetical protein
MSTIPTISIDIESNDSKNKKQVNSKIVKDKVKEVTEKYNDLISLALLVGKLGKNQSIQLSDGTLLGKKEFKRLVHQANSEAGSLNKVFADSLKASKTRRAGGVGFRCPIIIAKNLQSFFDRGSFGKVDPSDPLSSDLISQLPLLTKGLVSGHKVGNISNRAILTPLFIIYTYVNNLQNSDNAQFIHADSVMKTLFKPTFETLASKDQSAESFRYSSLQTIVRDNSGKLTDSQKEGVKNSPEIQAQLQKEHDIVSSVLDKYRELRKPLLEERKKRKALINRKK